MEEVGTKDKLKSLVDKYEIAKNTTGLQNYSEEDTIKDFILPLFGVLGWDTYDKREVSAQDHIKNSGRPDYTFKIDGITQFYLEAKKLSVNLDDEKFAFQAINYSWNKGVTYAILTDFEAIKVFNAQRIDKTALMDKLVFEIPYTKYVEEFETLWLLSKQAFKEKKLDSFAEKYGKKEKTISVASVIKKLDEDIQWCRRRLTESFERCNSDDGKKNVPKNLLDEGVQKLLDRLIFLRVAEDREVEPNILKNLLRESETTKDYKPFQAMVATFRELHKVYDSNLFSHHPFEEWQEWDGALEEVITRLYGKKGYYEYNFKEMPADVLGSVYESYLGYKLQTAKSRNKKLFGDDVREITINKDAQKRKEQGIYYTPIFIVDYIVKNALKPVLDKCISINDLKKIKVLDPACGSGSFLIKALEAIAEKYKEFGTDNEIIKRQIILENIYGVDLDMQAVEIARLNLLINSLDSKAALPMLDKNIKNGNSLTLNWQEEFPEVFKQDGFDVIIGNPPYIKEFVNKNAFNELHDSPYYQGKMDIWTMFACISIDRLKNGGTMSFIAPNNWVSNAGASIFRDKGLKDGELKTFIDFGDYKVFEDAGIQTMIYIFEKKKPNEKYAVEYLRIDDKNMSEAKLALDIFSEKQKINIEPEKLIGKNITFSTPESGSIFDKLESKKNFELTDKEVGQGIVADPDKAFIFDKDNEFSTAEKMVLKSYFTSVARYFKGEQRGLIAYLDKSQNQFIDELPKIKNQLLKYKKELDNRREVKSGKLKWFNLHWPRDENFFTKDPKIVCGVRVKHPCFCYTEDEYYGSRALNFIKTERINLKYLVGILNSKISYFWLKNKGKRLGDLLQIDKGPLMGMPIHVGNEKEQKLAIDLVDKMIELHKKLAETEKDSNAWHKLKEEIESTDKKVDVEVYKLYELTDEEIKIIGGN